MYGRATSDGLLGCFVQHRRSGACLVLPDLVIPLLQGQQQILDADYLNKSQGLMSPPRGLFLFLGRICSSVSAMLRVRAPAQRLILARCTTMCAWRASLSLACKTFSADQAARSIA